MKQSAKTMQQWTPGPVRLALLALCVAGMTAGSAAAQTYTLTDLGTLGGVQSIPVAINASGQVAGDSLITGNGEIHGFLFGGGAMTDLGTLGGTYSAVHALNDAGQVTGHATTGTAQHAFLWSNGVMTDLGTLGGGSSGGDAINSTGQVAGMAGTPDGWFHAFLYANGVMTDLGTFGGVMSRAFGINEPGQVTGFASTSDNAPHAFLYNNGVMTDLGTLGGGNSVGLAINDAGQVTGEADIAGWLGSHAFLYADGVMTDLGTLGGSRSVGVAINASGQVTGWSFTAGDATERAFLYSNGVMRDLGTPAGTGSAAFAINAAGQVTGHFFTADGEERAFLYSGGSVVDLNTLIPPDSGWTLAMGTDINDSGQITGGGLINGEGHAFLLTPVAAALAHVQQPIDADGSSVFNARRGVIPVRFTLTVNGTPTCQLPPATIAVTRTDGGSLGAVDESLYSAAADEGTDFRIADCQYIYNLSASALGAGHYRVTIAIDGTVVGQAEFSLR